MNAINFSAIYQANINKSDKVFIDANILIFLFSPDFVKSDKHQVEKYSELYGILLSKDCKLYVNSIVISEFINRCLRIDFNKNFQDEARKQDFKKNYRKNEQYKETLSLILKELKKFMEKNVSRINDNFYNFDVNKEYRENENFEFNDLIIAKNVIDNDLKLLTDDRDFENYKNINTSWYLPNS